MAPNLHIKKAFMAMRAMGIEDARVKPVLKNLLALYEKNWELIAEDNYRVLADAIFDSHEDQAIQESEEKKADEVKEDEGCVCFFQTIFHLLVQCCFIIHASLCC
jgi:hypothetical protein